MTDSYYEQGSESFDLRQMLFWPFQTTLRARGSNQGLRGKADLPRVPRARSEPTHG